MNQKDVYDISKTYLQQSIEEFSQKDVQIFQDIMKYHSELYYEKESPIISDTQYDVLFQKLQQLEEVFLLTEKVSQTVGSEGKRSSFLKVAHARPMISLDNTYNQQELQDFDTRIKRILATSSLTPLLTGEGDEKIQTLEYTLEFKFDGLGVELVYKK